MICVFFFCKQKTAYEMRISDWSSDVCYSDLLHVFLGEGERRLPQVLRIGAQHRDLAPGQAGPQHQPVEAVVLHAPVPHRREGFLERLLDPAELDVAAVAPAQREVVDPDRPRAPQADLERARRKTPHPPAPPPRATPHTLP